MNCIECEQAFVGSRSNQKYCTAECRTLANEEKVAANSRKHYLKNKKEPIIVPEECSGCGEAFVKKNSRHIYCTVECRLLAIKGSMTKDCVCGKTFVARRRNQRFCSDKCRKEAYWSENLEKRVAYQAKYRAKSREKRAAYAIKYVSENQERLKSYRVEYRKKNAERLRADARGHGLQSRYGLTLVEWNGMFAAQGSKCAICFITEPGGKNWHTDHNHGNGKIRGILCQSCNHMIGNARDNVDTLKQGINYLLEHN